MSDSSVHSPLSRTQQAPFGSATLSVCAALNLLLIKAKEILKVLHDVLQEPLQKNRPRFQEFLPGDSCKQDLVTDEKQKVEVSHRGCSARLSAFTRQSTRPVNANVNDLFLTEAAALDYLRSQDTRRIL